MRPDFRLLAAALPALGGSLLLMRQADVGAGPLILQTAVAVVSFAAVALTRPRAADEPTRERALLAVAIATALAAGVAWAWWQPDPLLPVPHVEGVLDLAAAAGPVWFAAAVIALALPLLALARLARASNAPALLSVAIYYVVIDVLAWRQLTPMPLLGYGAGPIVGYALMAASARRRP